MIVPTYDGHVHMCVYAHTCAHIPAYIHTYVCVSCFCMVYLWCNKTLICTILPGCLCLLCSCGQMCVYAHTCAHIPAYMTHTHTYIHTYLLMLAMWNHGDSHLRDMLGFRFFIFSKTKTCKWLFLCMLAMCTCVYMNMDVHTCLHTYTHM